MVIALCMVNQYALSIMESIMVFVQKFYTWEMSWVANVLCKVMVKDIARIMPQVAFENL